MDNDELKMLLITLLQEESKSKGNSSSENLNYQKLAEALSEKNSEVSFRETSEFTCVRGEWNICKTFLDMKIPFQEKELFNQYEEEILKLARLTYQNDSTHSLYGVHFYLLPPKKENIDTSSFTLTNIKAITMAIDDAKNNIEQGKYSEAVDRIHTALHGYLRYQLDELKLTYYEKDTVIQLYTTLHPELSKSIIDPEISDLIKSIFRSLTSSVTSINDFRNKKSLAHPNKSILPKREAELAVKLIVIIVDYIEDILNSK